ncbi:hypothetical protein EJ06DRAFT_531278 [Trichodelitschia bisporula]|uniref:Nephrocystin 3-like N-terminal domain-containing protein n=1 Tax=Trichodelitschia bisporula TaxID=703511 RepID=A0A6G1HT09_9PEZI|nr:hypothetical protein EJ06DRAFT_531278 [Trichodelitschia bisporula]
MSGSEPFQYKGLSPPSPSDTQGLYQKSRAERASSWLLDEKLYMDWLLGKSKSPILCCYGDEGVGKGFLTAFLIEHIQGMEQIQCASP